MSDQFTPTTEQVRDGYRFDPGAEYRDPISAGHLAIVNGYAFDRWLARVKREAAAEALEEAAEITSTYEPWDDPHAVAEALLARAEDVREGLTA